MEFLTSHVEIQRIMIHIQHNIITQSINIKLQKFMYHHGGLIMNVRKGSKGGREVQ